MEGADIIFLAKKPQMTQEFFKKLEQNSAHITKAVDFTCCDSQHVNFLNDVSNSLVNYFINDVVNNLVNYLELLLLIAPMTILGWNCVQMMHARML